MGGSQEMIDASNQYSDIVEEFKYVHFYIFFSRPGQGIADFNLLYNKIISEICNGLDKYGVESYEVHEVGGGGGGGDFETIAEIIKSCWQRRDLIVFFGSLLSYFKGLYFGYLNSRIKNYYPKISVHFKIETESKIDKVYEDDLSSVAKEKLANLLIISNAILNDIHSVYEIIEFDLSVEVSLNEIEFSTTFNLPQKYRNKREKQVLRLIKRMPIKRNTQNVYYLKAHYLVKKCVQEKYQDDLTDSKIRFIF